MDRDSGDPYATIAQRLGGRLSRRWTLEGGVSANVQALELILPDGTTDRVVVRQHGAAGWKPLEDGVTSTEYGLLNALADTELPVPRPRLLDLSGTVLPGPYLVLPFVDGIKEPLPLQRRLKRMADFLVRLHALDVKSLDLPALLPRRDDPVPGIMEFLPDGFEHLKALLKGRDNTLPPMASILHGDFWTGNILWQDGQIAAVIDWEDSAVGDPISDLAGARVELLWKYDESTMEAFTKHYECARGHSIIREHLALWELYVGSAALAFMGRWGLDPQVVASMRSKTKAFLARASEKLIAT